MNAFDATMERIRRAGGELEFGEDEQQQLHVYVSLPVPGTTGLAVYASTEVKERESIESRAEAAGKCFDACRSKLLTMKDLDAEELTMSIEDVEMLAKMGIN